jgi:HAD superfamily hydrolase (TIGR01490 family)
MKYLALFDFDETISIIDSTKLFYKTLYKNKFLYFFNHYILCGFELLKSKFGLQSYLILKNKRLKIHLDGLTENEFKKVTSIFNEKIIDTIINVKAMETIEWHKLNSHDVWVVSASYDFLIANWCEKNGLRLLVNKTKYLKKKIYITNEECNYDGKVTHIKNNINLDDYDIVYAYGDSSGDLAMLELADIKKFKVF